VFENRMQRRISGPKRDEMTGGWRKIHSEELRKLYSSPIMIMSRKMWACGRREMYTGFWFESQKKIEH
jgi:hypothetical protein